MFSYAASKYCSSKEFCNFYPIFFSFFNTDFAILRTTFFQDWCQMIFVFSIKGLIFDKFHNFLSLQLLEKIVRIDVSFRNAAVNCLFAFLFSYLDKFYLRHTINYRTFYIDINVKIVFIAYINKHYFQFGPIVIIKLY